MKTEYYLNREELDPPPQSSQDVSTFHDLDSMGDHIIEHANMFAVCQRNAGHYHRGELPYDRSEHLTLSSARIAAKTRYENDPRQRPCVIYAIMLYSNNQMGFSEVAETYPASDSVYSRTGRIARRNGKPAKLLRSRQNMLPPDELQQTERYFESTSQPMSQEDVQRALTATKIVGKGGSKVAVGYKNKRGK